MLAWLSRKRWSRNLDSLGVRHRKPGARAQRLGVESLEVRCLLTVAPFVGPVVPTSVFHTDGPAFGSAPTASAPAASPATSASAEDAASQSVNAFGLDLFKQLQKSDGGDGNMFVSPFSISTALAMVYAGARGDTAAQIAKVLHFDSNQQQVAHDFGALLASLNGNSDGDYTLSAANGLWTQDGIKLLSAYLNSLQTDFQSGALTVDFANHPEAARQTINDWVTGHTNQRIQDLFPDGSVNKLTELVLANAVYFDAKWVSGFDKSDTYDADFTLGSGEHELVSTMHHTFTYGYMQRDGFRVVQMPYNGFRLVMDVLLPTGGADLNVDRLPSDLNSWYSAIDFFQVSVSLPKFTAMSEYDLGATLGGMGMPRAFSNGADFSGMSNTSLKVSQVVHKAFIDVDESGTQAAAATGSTFGLVSSAYYNPPPPLQFNADRPFLYMIRDTLTGSVLFMGQEAAPPASDGKTPSPANLSQSSASASSGWTVIGASDAPVFGLSGGHQDVFVGPVEPGTLIFGSLIMVPPKPLSFTLVGYSLTAAPAAQTGITAAPLDNAADGPVQQPLLAPLLPPISATPAKKFVAGHS